MGSGLKVDVLEMVSRSLSIILEQHDFNWIELTYHHEQHEVYRKVPVEVPEKDFIYVTQ